MTRRATVATAVLLGLLATAAPAFAAGRATLSGRVLDETGRPVAGASVRVSVPGPPPGFFDGLGHALGCLFAFFGGCDPFPDSPPVAVTARTDASGRYVLRLDSRSRLLLPIEHGVDVTGPATVRGTLPPTTSTDVAYRGGGTLPAVRLWLRGASVDPVNATRRRLRATVPATLGRVVSAPKVVLVQGGRTVWSFGAVPLDRLVDTRLVEQGTTGTQTTVTTRSGSTYATYRSGVRTVTRTVRPLSRGKRCYDHGDVPGPEVPGCPQTDGRLADEPVSSRSGTRIVVDLGALSTPQAYVVRGCDVRAVAASVEGVAYLGVAVKEPEPGLYAGEPDLPVRYVRLDLWRCDPAEVSVFGVPYDLPDPLGGALRQRRAVADPGLQPGALDDRAGPALGRDGLLRAGDLAELLGVEGGEGLALEGEGTLHEGTFRRG